VLENGAIWRLVLATPKANVLDAAKIGELAAAFRAASTDPRLACILIEGEGPHFSFGASVEEHLQGKFVAMLASFHGLFRSMLETGVPTLAAVRGQCLGGALELASFSTRVFASPDAKLGQPEIKLGVIAPVASAFLAERVGRAAAEELCLTGRSLGAAEALAIGLVDEIADDPDAAAIAWAKRELLPLSTSSLRLAQRALRIGLSDRMQHDLERVERLYRDELMKTADAVEGLNAFLEKRAPVWSQA
jgi:cyclohexa-1,5-dienecarbonyl-CoA hydratase